MRGGFTEHERGLGIEGESGVDCGVQGRVLDSVEDFDELVLTVVVVDGPRCPAYMNKVRTSRRADILRTCICKCPQAPRPWVEE